MRSDAIDQLLSRYFELPARVSWRGALADSARGTFDEGRLELSGVAVWALPFDRLVLESDRFQFMPGIPARIAAYSPRISISIDQRQLDRWLARARAPFSLQLAEHAVEFRAQLAGLPLIRTETELRIDRGWVVLQPRQAEFLGIRNRLATLFRTSLPIPRLAPQTRLEAVDHEHGALRMTLSLEDFEEQITPGMIDRLRDRFIPFARPMARWASGDRTRSSD